MFEFISRHWITLLIIFGIGFLFIPMRMCLHVCRGHNEVMLNSRVTFWIIPIEINLINPVTKTVWNLSQNSPWKKKSPQEIQGADVNWKRFFSRICLLRSVRFRIWKKANLFFIRINRRISVTELNMYTEIGLTDAAQTALSVGAFWSLLGILYGRMTAIFNMSKTQKKISIVPNYRESGVLLIDYTCIFEFRLGHIIIIMIQVLRNAAEIYTMVRRISR